MELGVMAKMIEIGILRWPGQLCRMQEKDPCRKLTLLKPEGTRLVGIPKFRWLESVEEDHQKIGVTTADVGHWTEKSGGQFWRRLIFTKHCNVGIRINLPYLAPPCLNHTVQSSGFFFSNFI